MELEFEKRTCRYLDRVIRDTQAEEQTQEIRLGEGMPDVGRVIGAWGQVILRGKEWRGDQVILSGGIMAWVLYAPEDGTEVRCLDAWIPFKMKWELPEGAREGDIRVSCLLRSVDGRSVSPRKILVRAVVSLRAEALSPGEEAVYMPGNTAPDLELLRKTYPVRLPREAGEKTFLVDEELTFGTGPMPEKLLFCRVEPRITEEKVLSDKVVFRGNGNLHLLGRTGEGQLHAWDFELPFSQIAQLREDYSPEARAELWMGVTSLEPELDTEGKFRVKCGLVGQYLVDDREMVELVEDAYSPIREITAQTRELKLPTILESRRENLYGEQKLPVDGSRIVDCVFLPEHPRARRTDAGVTLEIPGLFQLLSYGENGELMVSAARWETEMTLPADEAVQVEVDLMTPDGARVSIGDGSVEMSVELPLKLSTVSRQGLTQMTGMTLGEERQPDPARPSLILRRAGKDSLWRMAKDCGSTVEAIRLANDLREEPEPDRMLLIPVS